MELVLIGLGLLAGGGLAALLSGANARLANVLGSASSVAGSVLALLPVLRSVASGATITMQPLEWPVPYGAFAIELDPLSAWFALPILGLSALAALYGYAYLKDAHDQRGLGAMWFFFNLLVVSMVVVVLARNGVLFLVAWELMSLTSFFLVLNQHEKEAVREAARIYLIAMQLGAAFLLAFFILLGREAGSLNFADIAAAAAAKPFSPAVASYLFLLAVIGFGIKAGFFPFHVWLPEAHPVAPSHVSAVMSGVMIKTGIYGLLRALTFLNAPPQWWAWVLIGIGVSSGVLGVLFALTQHDLKRLLAYHSIENIGIIALGMGVGLLGLNSGSPSAAVLGFGGALLHVLNHALFKGLLFLVAGAVIHGTGTGDIDKLGGLLKRMPWAGATFLVGAAAISGLPPLNGFISEFLIYLGAFQEGILSATVGGVFALATIGGLALMGGLAAACFAKAFGVVFLGSPRTEHAQHAHPPHTLMLGPMLVLAAGCIGVGLLAQWVVPLTAPALVTLVRQPAADVIQTAQAATISLSTIAVVFGTLLGLVVALTVVRMWLLSGREIEETETWGCGYSRPTPRMQYTSASFAEPITTFFAPVLQPHTALEAPEGLFPRPGAFEVHTPDLSLDKGYRPLARLLSRWISKLQWVQQGRVHIYVLYIAVTIVLLLAWYLGFAS